MIDRMLRNKNSSTFVKDLARHLFTDAELMSSNVTGKKGKHALDPFLSYSKNEKTVTFHPKSKMNSEHTDLYGAQKKKKEKSRRN